MGSRTCICIINISLATHSYVSPGTVPDIAQTACVSCPAGHSCPDPRQPPAPCPAGSHSPGGGAVPSCSACPVGHACPSPAVSPQACALGSYAGLGSVECLACPAGAACPNTTSLPQLCSEGEYSELGGESLAIPCHSILTMCTYMTIVRIGIITVGLVIFALKIFSWYSRSVFQL